MFEDCLPRASNGKVWVEYVGDTFPSLNTKNENLAKIGAKTQDIPEQVSTATSRGLLDTQNMVVYFIGGNNLHDNSSMAPFVYYKHPLDLREDTDGYIDQVVLPSWQDGLKVSYKLCLPLLPSLDYLW